MQVAHKCFTTAYWCQTSDFRFGVSGSVDRHTQLILLLYCCIAQLDVCVVNYHNIDEGILKQQKCLIKTFINFLECSVSFRRANEITYTKSSHQIRTHVHL